MKALLSLLLLCSVCCVVGQRRVNVNEDITLQTGAFFQAVNGVPVAMNTYYKVVEGSPFFNPEWMKGSVTVEEEREYKGLWLKLDLLSNELRFRDTKGDEMICSTPLKKITLGDSASGRQYFFVHSSYLPEMSSFKNEFWLQVMAKGRASLYMQHKKAVSEVRPYGSATLEQHIMTTPIHYLVVNNQHTRVKKLADVLNVLSDKKAELQQWLKKNDIDARNPEDLARLVEAYNNLFPKS